MRKYLLEVESKLKGIKPPAKPSVWLAKNYIGGEDSKLVYLDMKIPIVRKTMKEGFSFSKYPPAEQWQIWDYIWNNSNIFEVMLGASFWAASRPMEEVLKYDKMIFGWLERIDNWAHSDELSSHVARIFEHNHARHLSRFEKWSKSPNPWLRRQSIVGLLYYSRSRKKVPPAKKLLDFVERQIEHEHYYVQKGVGWTLREIWNVYPDQAFAYLKKNAARIPSGGWTAATEKLSAREKAQLKELRQKR